ncbi:malto-oligosyltrehalose synthase [Acidipropionibacterium jensenii]|uniref:malto-oligosyltrehalose synthase n=1 Tax=Acidipropionibacterium jensenii TaxID=1749 RepID=UPI0026499C5F|nr:malto-oligosyltrehalose synthase [Acidipropionibacterium jensenii]MDN5978485.1 malto-oligosyltrehalose synthase [Acidipropionibacterium jensenii]MDN5997437.1 malto-oligosyltrehalose synthase [Acidipropionibacterium jensenii]MDN6425859.1 malto-oligosyltrehalose synthase [Acidipropionibacterium jensenii]MDN6441854.1 malto-oligosyltrehalose synthase [Acidipropionibacterium jensenii]MDN6480542.1 malto-oligosyltrehalose synthase [Acidipropionibacterium jensenii]
MGTVTPPSSDFATPASTYRLQFNADFGYDDARARLDYFRNLGVTHLFCSPILQAAPGSTHGYDVVDHTRVWQECGGEDAFRRLCTAAHEHDIGIVVDVVPNHMAVPTPLWHNRPLWDALRQGPSSPFSSWFDIDLSNSLSVLMPVLGDRIGTELANGNIHLETRDIPLLDQQGAAGSRTERQNVVVYFDHVFPVRPGTDDLPLAALLDQQWYRLAYWKVASEELNYRRFFDVDTLAAIRVEDDEVFQISHAKLLELYRDHMIDGFRIDHPDGLANPRKYLNDLRRATDGAWVVVEKILEPSETLPSDFACNGTTGYDSLLRVDGLFSEPNGLSELDRVWERLAGTAQEPAPSFSTTLRKAKREVISDMLFTEVNRLTSLAVSICAGDIMLRDHTRRQLRRAITALLTSMDRYRAYIEPGVEAPDAEKAVIQRAADRARHGLDEDEMDSLDLVVSLACGTVGPAHDPYAQAERDEFITRFAQTCGPVMAKSKEDTAFYRYTRYTAVNEVGSDPGLVGVSLDDFHNFAGHMDRAWPTTMTTLSTHDTKRSSDVRARLSALLEYPTLWAKTVGELETFARRWREDEVDGATANLLWQTLVGTWRLPGTAAGAEPISPERLSGYLTKAMREAKTHTSWTEQDADYEKAVLELAAACLEDPTVSALLDEFTWHTFKAQRAAILGRKLIQLTMPGVPDSYQGCELVDLSLVDPDNRRPVDLDYREDLLGRLRPGTRSPLSGVADEEKLDAEKLLVTSSALRLRRAHRSAFRGSEADYRPVATTTGHAAAFARLEAGAKTVTSITVATRLAGVLAERHGWADHHVVLPEGRFRDLFTGRELNGGQVSLAELMNTLPVALLVPQD